MQSAEGKRRGRPPGKSAPLTNAERVARHRERKRAQRIEEIESDPQRTIAHLRAALEATQKTLSAAAEKQRELTVTIDDLHRKLADCEHVCNGLRRDRDLRDDEIERFRELMSGQLSEERLNDFFADLYQGRREADEPW